ncbi:hypothetical protein OW763_16445 [Clostridium aestuarii]|uniref:DUF4044 domain-containing protein n=1 Tax=Clostridium aestuarii TaxID=338193 RepID=A0ABT4D5I2_9CLOT|nr:hypothetical protein [Clostridium aestuarii]MCY6485902.1 hypothetical protein [Clostridium aestuarii]
MKNKEIKKSHTKKFNNSNLITVLSIIVTVISTVVTVLSMLG